ncbi:S8 family serine peptidase [Aliikangiella marina]|uniref:S8 family serine peptidase n=1 Tax=Aliikangiella marina TaxID=1712262 RepID=A0A545T6B2_9GAMM|nr:S8 family serine peptidase [Aliikangiella marina]TQV72766.1 S8 family serine peptidase [Aliikangiella marina]
MKKIITNPLFKKSVVATLLCGAFSVNAADNRYIIQLKSDSDGKDIPYSIMSESQRELKARTNALKIENFGGIVKRSLVRSNSVAAELSTEQLVALKRSGIAALIEEDPRRYLIEPVETNAITIYAEDIPYGINMVQALDVSDANSGNRKVCITDTGYDGNHEDLRAYTGSNINGDDNNGAGSDTGDWFEDGHGHGTHVAGTISAHGNNGVGVVGVNRSNQIGLHIVKVFNNSGRWGYGSDLIAAINQCVDAGANIISMSLGGGASSNAERNAFEDAFDAGVLSIAAAGNDGSSSGNDAFSYPASYDVVMSVAAINSSKNVASWSQKNSQVEIAAPGVAVESTLPNNAYDAWSGTSMATPHVAGVAALVWSNFTECSATEIRNAMNSTAEDLGASGRDESYGFGLIQASDMYDQLASVGCGGNIPPNSAFTESCTELSCDFDASTSNDSDGVVVSYEWDFGDGNMSSGETTSHVYGDEGSYTVTLTVTDDQGDSDSESKVVNVSLDGGGTGGSFEENGLSAWWWGWNRSTIEIPSGMSSLTISTNGGFGSADLYLRHDSAPSTSNYDCRSNNSGNSEICTISSPQPGTWHIGVKAGGFYFTGLTLTGEWN